MLFMKRLGLQSGAFRSTWGISPVHIFENILEIFLLSCNLSYQNHPENPLSNRAILYPTREWFKMNYLLVK
jgi:hypothetical protein